MAAQGAGFAFDPSMDFSNFFATSQQSFKPVEDNTSGFFFADEGIDTATSSFIDPTVFEPPQQSTFDMQHSLTLDNTSGITSPWDTQLTPHMQHTMNDFPLTPIQSFDTVNPQLNALGKRPLQLDTHNVPQAKRHESFDFPLFPTPPTTGANWDLGSQTLPSSTTIEGLSDEAADVCATWFNKYNVLPTDRHIESLSQLTGESADFIRSWFGQLLKQGMGGGSQSDSAYKSQTAPVQLPSFWHDHTYSTQLMQARPPQLPTPDVTSEAITTVVTSASSLRATKKRCTPTEDLELLGRDPRKIYQCTRKCGKRYGRKNDWKRNEEEGYPCKSWVCSICTTEGVENVKPCYRKYHFVQHFRNIHPEMNADDYDEASVVYSETEFPRKCGFCRHRFTTRQERIDHIADHFKQGKCMLDWRDEDIDSHDSDNGDDGDDRPSGDDFDGEPPQQPPYSDPRDDSDSKYSGSGASNGSSGTGQSSQGGFFQFQLSQLGESQLYCAAQPIRPTILSPNISQSSTSLESDTATSLSVSGEQHSLHDWKHTSTEDHQAALAGNAVSKSLTDHLPILSLAEPAEDCLGQLFDILGSSGKLSEIQVAPPQYVLPTEKQDTESPGFSLVPLMEPFSRQNLAIGPTSLGQPILQIPKTAQSFLSVKLLGSGGFSTVDEVVHRQTGLHVGRKTLKNRKPSAIEDLKKEVSVLQKLRHPHVIRLLGTYSKGEKMSVLLSPVAETTLALWLQRSAVEKPANLAETVTKMFGCLASSVRYLHEQRPVVNHMDIKPQNILIIETDQEFPHVVLSDFGISSSDEQSNEQNKPLTRQYTAPEVFQGFERKQAADIWSLGCVFAEMASVPFSQGNTRWLTFRKEFSGRAGKYYWQDVPGVQDRLSTFLNEAETVTEQVVVRTLQTMMNAEPDKRPDAASLTMIFTPAPCCLSWPNDKTTFPSPNEELDALEMLVHEHGVDCCTEPHTHTESGGQASVAFAKAKIWQERCLNFHEACGPVKNSDAHTLPKRLIDVLPDGLAGTYVRIVNSDELEPWRNQVDYVAMNHMWSASQLLLTAEALSSMQTELPLQTLPDSVIAALSAVQGLGYRYLWVDSLCTLQDSLPDKERECKSMKATFRNAALTLVLDPTTTSASTPQTRLPPSILAQPNFAWDTRAWALQDRLLSRRFLHLGGAQMYWECNTLKASETFPTGLEPLVWEKLHTQPTTTRPRQNFGPTPHIAEARKLTNIPQRNPAFWPGNTQLRTHMASQIPRPRKPTTRPAILDAFGRQPHIPLASMTSTQNRARALAHTTRSATPTDTELHSHRPMNLDANECTPDCPNSYVIRE
ncbi:hypothetical protein BDW02DRAFT_572611 [Decorospora gaudefroyi]|uniref:Protein kinase domain-containing protein n=1 Tax=Decorospora gaudefroyi TaxID=184978 RepID=A0A6A5K223_9PLEO|nr:hypothetical protein BDW02DRAFT_572611 [Decorospora gaudefroyi]